MSARLLLLAMLAPALMAQTYTNETRATLSNVQAYGYSCPGVYGQASNWDQHVTTSSESLYIGQNTYQYSWGSMCFVETRQPVLRFDTNGLGTILSASLTIYVNANGINQSTSGRTFYLKQKTTYPPVFADIYPYIDFSSGVTMGTSSMTSGWSGTGARTIPLSNPDADINKSSFTYILLGHNIPAACGGCNSRILIDSYQMTNKPYLSLTLAGGARVIVVAEQ
jgi:hypothetical protein